MPLPARALVGRAPASLLRLADPRVSGEHATVLWNGAEWVLRDLGSRNGTFVNGHRVGVAEEVALRPGSRLGFGSPEARFVLVDGAPPGPVLRDLDSGDLRAPVDGILCVPHEDHPEVVVFDDGRGHWAVELGDERRPAIDGDVLRAGGRSWQLLLAEEVEGTAAVEPGPTIDTITLRMRASRDEEHVDAWVLFQGRTIELDPREHLYVLLLLARQRVLDAALPPSEQGWVDRDQLLGWLRLAPNRLNVAIHRARGHLARKGVAGAAAIVEVRRGKRRIGIEPERLEVS